MTTERQRRANQANGLKGRGPSSEQGRTRSAGNSKKHGLTAAVDFAEVLKWFRVIVSDSEAVPDPVSWAPLEAAAWKLAEAEVRYARALLAEKNHIFYMAGRAVKPDTNKLDDVFELFKGNALENLANLDALRFVSQRQKDPNLRKVLNLLVRIHPDQPVALRRKLRLLGRYRSEAERARRNAFQEWFDMISAKNTKQTQLQPVVDFHGWRRQKKPLGTPAE